MNSLTTVGGTVIDEEEFNGDRAAAAARHPKRPPSLLRGRGRMNHDTRRVRSVGDANHRAPESTSVDFAVDPIKTATRPTSRASSLGRRRSAPTDAKMDAPSFALKRSTSPARYESSSASSPVPEARDPSITGDSPSSTKSVLRFSSDASFGSRASGPGRAVSDSESPPAIRALKGGAAGKSPTSHHSLEASNRVDKKQHSAILAELDKISKMEPYASSPYFRRVFAKGMANVEQYKGEYKGESSELRSVEDALRACFNVNEDMTRVIASAGKAAAEKEALKKKEAEERVTTEEMNKGIDQKVVTSVGLDDTPIEERMVSKPWEDTQTERKVRNGGILHRQSRFSSQTDLSGYTQRNSQKSSTPGRHVLHDVNTVDLPPNEYQAPFDDYGVRTPQSNPAHALSLPLPPTPQTPGKMPSSPYYSNEFQDNNAYPPPPSTPSAYTTGRSPMQTLTRQEYLQAVSPGVSPGYLPPSTPTATLEDVQADSRKAKARARVMMYMEQIDDRIRSVKEGRAHRNVGGSRPGMMKRVQSSGVAMGNRVMDEDYRHMRPWDSFDGLGAGGSRLGVLKKQLLLPSLLSPDDSVNGNAWEQTSSSVFRANAAVVEAAQSEDSPLDEQNAGQDLEPFDSLPRQVSRPSEEEQLIRAVEKSMGLKSLQEYKRLLREKTLEMEGLEHRFKTQLEETEGTLERRDEEVRQFHVAMEEAQRAVAALEDTIKQLELASDEKDALIAQLETRVKVLESELEQSNASKLEKEIEHQESIKLLNESISQMASSIGGKDSSMAELQSRLKELEDELAKTMEQHAASQAELNKAQEAISSKDRRIQLAEEELNSTKVLLEGQVELYKNEISSSLENTSQLMDLMSKEKDSLISSLQAKIEVLAQSLAELEEEKESGDLKRERMEKEFNDKISTLALALTEKDGMIGALQKETKEMKSVASSKKSAGTQTRSEKKHGDGRKKKNERSRDHHAKTADGSNEHRRSHSKHRHQRDRHHKLHHRHQRRTKPTPEGYYSEGYYDEGQRYLPRRYDDARDDEMYDEMMLDDGSAPRHHPVVYYSASASDDSIFDFA